MNTPLVRMLFTAAAAIGLAGPEALLAQTATWVENTPASSPLFAHHDMAYDSLRGRLIVAGRTSIMSPALGIYAGLPDGSWTRLPAPSPAVPGRHDLELAYDSHRDVVVLYTDATNLVWELSGTNWSVITAATRPVQCRDGALMQYDPARRRTVLVGTPGPPESSLPVSTSRSETWLWDGTDWAQVADTNSSPRGAAGGGMAFDAARGEMVLLTMGTMQTWVFDGTKWRQRHPATLPSPGLWVFHLAYDPVNQLSVFFCGETTQQPLAYPRNTWAWDGTDWRKLAPLRSPPATIDYTFAYFPERNALVLHGGWNDPNWQFRRNVWLLTIQNEIRFTGLQLDATDISLTSTGRVQTGARQILLSSTNLAAPATWVNTLTNSAPTATNTWLVPRLAGPEFFRIVEQP